MWGKRGMREKEEREIYGGKMRKRDRDSSYLHPAGAGRRDLKLNNHQHQRLVTSPILSKLISSVILAN